MLPRKREQGEGIEEQGLKRFRTAGEGLSKEWSVCAQARKRSSWQREQKLAKVLR